MHSTDTKSLLRIQPGNVNHDKSLLCTLDDNLVVAKHI